MSSLLRVSLAKFLHSRTYSMELRTVVQKLDDLAPGTLAESWDNVGLLIEPHNKRVVQRMLLTNDLTEEVMEEAEQREVDFILSYHPPIFRPLKKITLASWKERIVAACLAKGVAVYSPHTAHDALKGGVNDWLISAFDCKDVRPIQQTSSPPQHSHHISLYLPSEAAAESLVQKLHQALNPSQATIRVVREEVSVQCQEKTLPLVFSLSTDTTTQLSITKLEKVPVVGCGMGRQGTLVDSMTVQEAVNCVKTHLGLNKLQVALASNTNMSSEVGSVCVCAGSGASVMRGMRGVDLCLTGEMSHHEVLDANHSGTTVILTHHSNSERGYLASVLSPRLASLLENKVEILVSKKDRDPLQVV